MNDIVHDRLSRQRLIGPPFDRPVDAIHSLLAVQSQDYAGATWGIAQCSSNTTSIDLDLLFDAGHILRTHVMRPTWHFVLPDDIRWLLQLTAPRVHALNAYYYKKLELDNSVLRRSVELIEATLSHNEHQTRAQLGAMLSRSGIESSGLRLAYLVMYAELEAVVCSGPRQGKQFTYALLSKRAPGARRMDRFEALAELTRRFFHGHGPATLKDMAWWSGLTLSDCKLGFEMVKRDFERASVDGVDVWFSGHSMNPMPPRPFAHFLPNYDEYLIGYRDNHTAFDVDARQNYTAGSVALNAHFVLIDGRVIGGWRRTESKGRVTIALDLLRPLANDEATAIQRAAASHSAFLGLPVDVVDVAPHDGAGA